MTSPRADVWPSYLDLELSTRTHDTSPQAPPAIHFVNIMSTRRKPPPSSPSSNGSIPSPIDKMTTQQQPAGSPFLPTPLETAILALYPATLLLGSLFSLVSPQTRAAPYDAGLQSHPPHLAPSYFAQKKNVFNVYFVKLGWMWTTFALVAFTFTHTSLGRIGEITPKRLQALARWGIATLWWVAVTQWFFGPPIVDRGFALTGGACRMLAGNEEVQDQKLGRALTHAACKAAGGRWVGGHDISGHVFLLILGNGLLWFEVLPLVLRATGLGQDRVVQTSDGQVARVGDVQGTKVEGPGAAVEKEKASATEAQATGFGVKFAIGVAALSCWMLLMTAAYFHTWFEKFTGLIVALAALWTIFLLPRGVPALRSIVGLPGL